MKAFIKGEQFTNWTELEFVDNESDDFKVRIVNYYINKGFDVRVEQTKEI